MNHLWGVECTLAVIGTGGPSPGCTRALVDLEPFVLRCIPKPAYGFPTADGVRAPLAVGAGVRRVRVLRSAALRRDAGHLPWHAYPERRGGEGASGGLHSLGRPLLQSSSAASARPIPILLGGHEGVIRRALGGY
eukprot:1195931-Prorocentrum_minimum.AAC.9